MKLRKIISGGQTGADRTGLEYAKTLGLATGGTAPKGWKVDGGSDPGLALFGLTESHSSDYAVRTRQNVLDADCTLWFGKLGSPGYWCTKSATEKFDKPFYVGPDEEKMIYVCNTFEIVNIAGNRKRINPDVVEEVKQAFVYIARMLGR